MVLKLHFPYSSDAELLDTRAARPFSFTFNTSDYRILHVDPDQGRLYMGTREYLVSLDMQNVNKEPLIVSILETNFFCTWHCMVSCYKLC